MKKFTTVKMDNKQFITRLAKRSGMDYKETAALLQSITSLMADKLSAGDTVAIPGFGSFAPEKLDETVLIDRSTGKRMLLPPQIVVRFEESAILSKRLDQ